MIGCGNCCGNCGGCGEMVLSEAELLILDELSQIPFLPVARTADDPTPIYPEKADAETSLALQCLEKRRLISIDFDKPLPGDPSPYPIRGSIALTARGQDILEILNIQGISQ